MSNDESGSDWKLSSPVFLLGHARGGSTALASALNWAQEIGPRHSPIPVSEDYQAFVDGIRDQEVHLRYSVKLEQKDTWFKYLGGEGVFTHMGVELQYQPHSLPIEKKKELVKELTLDLEDGLRFFSKAPTNSFRLQLLDEISVSPRIVAVVRKGESVVASWGRRPYGFNQKVSWGQFQRSKFSEQEAIGIFLRKWQEVIAALDEYRQRANLLIVDYDRLLESSEETLNAIYRFCDLDLSTEVAKARFANNGPSWEEVVSANFHDPLRMGCHSGNAWIRKYAAQV